MPIIRPFDAKDWPSVWEILRATVEAGDKFAYAPNSTEANMHRAWIELPLATFVAISDDGSVVGSYYVKPNQPGLGSHVCNAGYVVAEQARGSGVASLMCRHSQEVALAKGFKSMQFNLVVSTNEVAVRLWQRMGFDIIGTIPGAFCLPSGNYVAAHIMFKQLTPPDVVQDSLEVILRKS